jgi:type I restriction enzyme M protein
LNPGRYIGITEAIEVDYDFKEKLEEMNEELEELNDGALKIQEHISKIMNEILHHEKN